MSILTVTNGALQLFSFVDEAQCERVTSWAELPAVMHADWEGQTLNVIDWKIDGERQENAVCREVVSVLWMVEACGTESPNSFQHVLEVSRAAMACFGG